MRILKFVRGHVGLQNVANIMHVWKYSGCNDIIVLCLYLYLYFFLYLYLYLYLNVSEWVCRSEGGIKFLILYLNCIWICIWICTWCICICIWMWVSECVGQRVVRVRWQQVPYQFHQPSSTPSLSTQLYYCAATTPIISLYLYLYLHLYFTIYSTVLRCHKS